MGQMRTLLANLWQLRGVIVLSFIAFPALFAMYGVNQSPTYTAVQTLSLQPENAQSNLLQNVDNPEFVRILNRQLKNEVLLKTALNDVGVLLKGADLETRHKVITALQSRLNLEAAGSDVIEITLTHDDRAEILRLLEAIVLNFIDDIMAPERFAKDELANSLANQVQTIKIRRAETLEQLEEAKRALKKATGPEENAFEQRVAALEFQAQTLAMQKSLAENEYQKALSAAQQNMFHPVIKPESSPVIISTYGGAGRGLVYFVFGLIVASLFSAVVVVVGNALNTSLRRDEEIRKELGLRVLGRMPNLGNISYDDGRINTTPNINI